MTVSVGDMLAVAGALVVLGVQLATLAGLRERVARLERGARAQGGRLELLNATIAVLCDRAGIARRRPTLVGDEVDEDKEPAP